MQQELPGLVGEGFESIGKYGIGFFSTFMWGDHVKVITRRFDEGPRDSRVLEFSKGLKQPPILRPATENEQLNEPGTTVQVRLRQSPKLPTGFLWTARRSRISLAELCANLCPASAVTIHVSERSSTWRKSVSANDWKSLPPKRLLKRVLTEGEMVDRTERNAHVQRYADSLRDITDTNGRMLARACIMPKLSLGVGRGATFHGVVSIGGFRSSALSGVAGVFVGHPVRAARDVGVPIADGAVVGDWASEQSRLLTQVTAESDVLYECAQVIRALGGACPRIPIAEHRRGWLTSEEIAQMAGSSEEFALLQDATFSLDFARDKSVILDDVLVTSGGLPGVLQTGHMPSDSDYIFIDWPRWRAETWTSDWGFRQRTLEGAVIEALADGWSVPVEQVLKASEFATDSKPLERTVADVPTKRKSASKVNIMAIIRRAPRPIH